MNGHALEITPKPGTDPGGQLYQAVYQAAQQQQRQQQVDTHPHGGLPGVARLGNLVPHDGVELLAFEQLFPHGRMVTNWRLGL